VINLARIYKEKLVLNVIDYSVIEVLLAKMSKRAQELEKIYNSQIKIIDRWDKSKLQSLIDQDEHSIRIMDTILETELQSIMDCV